MKVTEGFRGRNADVQNEISTVELQRALEEGLISRKEFYSMSTFAVRTCLAPSKEETETEDE